MKTLDIFQVFPFFSAFIVVTSVGLSLLLIYWLERPYINWYKGVVARRYGKTKPAILLDRAR